MEKQSPIERLRPVVTRTIATNTRLLEQAPRSGPKSAASQRATHPLESLTALPGGVGDAVDRHIKSRIAPPSSAGERVARRLARTHLKGVGPVGDAIELATADDKGRVVAGIIGGRIGTAIGGAIPGAQIVTIPLGAVAGNWAGQQVYDHLPEISDFIESETASLRDQLGRELNRYVPYDLPDRLMRR